MSTLREYIREVMETMPQIQPESQIFCDMDGVLVDFGTAVLTMVNSLLDGEPLEHAPMTQRNADRLQRIRDELGKNWRATVKADLDKKPVRNFMFGAIGMNPGPVYAAMPAHQDAIAKLWPFLSNSGHRVNLLSAPIGTKNLEAMTSEEGKRIWAEQLEPAPAEIIITPATQKSPICHLRRCSHNILIDDRASTVDAWNAAGGIAILHIPGQSGATIRQLEEIGL